MVGNESISISSPQLAVSAVCPDAHEDTVTLHALEVGPDIEIHHSNTRNASNLTVQFLTFELPIEYTDASARSHANGSGNSSMSNVCMVNRTAEFIVYRDNDIFAPDTDDAEGIENITVATPVVSATFRGHTSFTFKHRLARIYFRAEVRAFLDCFVKWISWQRNC